MAQAQKLVSGGLRFGVEAPTNRKPLGEGFTCDKTVNFEIGVYVRVGRRFFGQMGGNYFINKTWLTRDTLTSAVEFGQINVPLWAGWRNPIGKTTFFRAMLGLQYRGLVRVSPNGVGVDRATFNSNNMDIMGGIGFDISIITLDVYYRKACIPLVAGSAYYQDGVHFSVGFLF
jgi:hypothetical protein